jgi:hypothetical protein
MACRFKSVDAQPLGHRPQRGKALTHPATPFLVLLLVAVAILGCGPDSNITPKEGRTTVKQNNSNKNKHRPAEAKPLSFWDHNRTVPKPASTEPHFTGSENCRECHAAIYQQYMRHPMAQSIRKLGGQTPLEQYLQNPTFESAGYQYEIRSDADSPESPPSAVEHIERVTSSNGQTVLEQSIPMHYVVGSGSRGRSFLHQAEDRLFQSPITWYVEKELWDLSPGYVPGNHQRFERVILDKCLACHAGKVNRVANKHDHFDSETPFREMGISCQRCHGDAQQHVKTHRQGTFETEHFIVNPAKLPTVEKESICNQCHLSGKYRAPRYGKSFFDFQPGMKLSDVWSVFIANSTGQGNNAAPILSHVEQMHASVCYQSPATNMTCTSCHDPHFNPTHAEKIEFYRNKCLNCHSPSGTQCSEPIDPRTNSSAKNSCFACHMPRIPNSDIAHSSQSDHRVLRRPTAIAFDNSSTIVKKDTDATPWVLFLNTQGQLPQWEIDRATGEALLMQYASVGEDQLLEQAENALTAAAHQVSNDNQLLRNLGRVYYLQNKTKEAISVLQRANEIEGNDATTISLLALCYHRQKDTTQGIALFSEWHAQSYQPSMEYGLFADLFYQAGKYQTAIDLLQESLRVNPTLTLHYRNLHIIQSRIGAPLEGQKNLRQAIILEQLTQPHLLDRPIANP